LKILYKIKEMKKESANNKKRILIVGAFPNQNHKPMFGGMITTCKILLESNFSKKFKIIKLNSTSFTTPPPNLFNRSMLAGIRLIKFFFKTIYKQPHVIIIFVADQYSALEKGLMILIGKFFYKKIMVFPRAGLLIVQYFENSLIKNYIKFTFSKADIFLSQGKSFQEFAIRELNFSSTTAPIIPNWTANPNHLYLGSTRNYLINKPTPKILFLGWLEDFKGVKEILEGVLVLKRKNYDFHLIFAGEGTCKSYTNEFINKNNLNEYISLAGWVNEERKLELLRKSNIFILPSWNEGFPNALIEAMSSGLACIVSSVGNIPDFVKNNHNCLLIKPKSVKEIVISLEKLLKDSKFRQQIAQNGYLYANSNFTADYGLELLSKEIKKISH